MSLLCHTLNAGLVVDDTLQHHHEAPRPLAKRAVGVLLQEGKQLGPDLGQHGGHVVSCQWVAVVQIHHCILQVAGQVHRGTQRSEDKSLKLPARHILFTVGMSKLLGLQYLAVRQRQVQEKNSILFLLLYVEKDIKVSHLQFEI